MNDQLARIKAISEEARAAFSQKFSAREQALRLSREAIQHCATAIRAIHRGQLAEARGLQEVAGEALRQADRILDGHRDVYYAGFVEDAQKEYAEAQTLLAVVAGEPLPGPRDLGVSAAPYLNGLAEAVGELRRYILDALRRDDVSRCEELLDVMDEVYTALVTMDFPDAITRGLRRTTDMVRGVLERTRGDLTTALRQRSLEQRLASLEGK
ncbi:MAG: haloacid dehalogenase [Chloroflexi bacterium]|nr:haloacid dehalogenase [Chloroflexota bacterium]